MDKLHGINMNKERKLGDHHPDIIRSTENLNRSRSQLSDLRDGAGNAEYLSPGEMDALRKLEKAEENK